MFMICYDFSPGLRSRCTTDLEGYGFRFIFPAEQEGQVGKYLRIAVSVNEFGRFVKMLLLII